MTGRRWRGHATWYPGGPSLRCPSARRVRHNGATAITPGVGLPPPTMAIVHPARDLPSSRRAHGPGPIRNRTFDRPSPRPAEHRRPSPQSSRRLSAPASVAHGTCLASRRPTRLSAPRPTIFLAKLRALVCSCPPWRLRGPTFHRTAKQGCAAGGQVLGPSGEGALLGATGALDGAADLTLGGPSPAAGSRDFSMHHFAHYFTTYPFTTTQDEG